MFLSDESRFCNDFLIEEFAWLFATSVKFFRPNSGGTWFSIDLPSIAVAIKQSFAWATFNSSQSRISRVKSQVDFAARSCARRDESTKGAFVESAGGRVVRIP